MNETVFVDLNGIDQSRAPVTNTYLSEAMLKNLYTPLERDRDDMYYRSGTLRQVLECGTKRVCRPVIADYISQPLCDVRSPFATDIVAWKATEGFPYCKGLPWPVSNTRWCHVGSAHSYLAWHIEPNGCACFLTCNSGKIVVLIQGDSHEEHTSNHRDTSILRYTSILPTWHNMVESVCLVAGDTMYVLCLGIVSPVKH